MNQFEQNHLILQQSIDQAIEKKKKLIYLRSLTNEKLYRTRFSKNNRRWAMFVDETHNESAALFDCRVCLWNKQNYLMWI